MWAYLRGSGDEQARRATPIASQRKAIEDYCHQNDLVLARTFSDEARPGDTTARRDDFNRIYDKTGLGGRSQAVRYAIEHGLVSAPAEE